MQIWGGKTHFNSKQFMLWFLCQGKLITRYGRFIHRWSKPKPIWVIYFLHVVSKLRQTVITHTTNSRNYNNRLMMISLQFGRSTLDAKLTPVTRLRSISTIGTTTTKHVPETKWVNHMQQLFSQSLKFVELFIVSQRRTFMF